MSVPREPRTLPLPRWTIDGVHSWAAYIGVSAPTLYKAIREGRFLIRRNDVLFTPAPRGKPVRGR